MKKEDILVVAQLLSGIKDAIDKLETAQRRKDLEAVASAKREILYFQAEIDKRL